MSDRKKTFAVVMPSMLGTEWSRCSYETERAVAALMEGVAAMEVPSRFGPSASTGCPRRAARWRRCRQGPSPSGASSP